ncbi:LTA synthase family protein [Streptococcus pantholopis]|uniref:Phosphoglycerol transferase n=1 Tax=Streptococcus pantholopis TaxID=1811193 RepID=A0A172Q6M4_9STRE|nr:LTA synthase family protein [Streptococcus pantholopis]AND79153.1 phosphoglycerol transferase [Streptococcus pantholopis]
MRKLLKDINWVNVLQHILLLIFTFYMNLYLVTSNLLSGHDMPAPFASLSFYLMLVYLLSVAALGIYFSKEINRSFFIKLGISYLIYLCVSYFLLVTRNINNKQFDPWALSQNHFFEGNALLTVGAIVAIGYLFHYLFEQKHYFSGLEAVILDYQPKGRILYLVLATIICNDSRLLHGFLPAAEEYFEKGNVADFISYLTSNLLWIIFLVVLLSITALQALRDLRRNKASLSLSLITSLFLALVFNYCLQYGVKGDSELLGAYIFPGAVLYQIIFLTVVYIMVYALINRYLLATLLITVSGVLISVANFIKESLRNEPLLITDFVWLQDVNLLVSSVNIRVVIYLVVMLLLTGAFYYYFRKKMLPGPIFNKKRVRFSILTALIGLSLFVFLVFKNEKNNMITKGIPVVSTVNNWANIEWMGFDVNARYKSLMYVWTKQMTKSTMDTPKDYSEENIRQIAEKYTNLAEEINADRANSISDQTVIYILSESFSDPFKVAGVTVSQDVMPNVREIETQTTSGLMRSDGYGGGTANMEFQTLTGLPFYNFSSSVSTLYTEVVPKMSIFPSISDQFDAKNRIVLHPSGAKNYNRKTVYEQLGFDTLIFSSDSDDTFENAENLGVSVSDETVYDNVLSQLKPDESQFFSVITMQNHVPWSVGKPADIQASGQDFSESQNGALTEYVRLLSYTDSATKDFLDSLSEVDKDITVVFYGDHLPGLYPDSAFTSDPDSQYLTDYFIWSNHETAKMDYPLVNSSDFTAELLAHTNSKVSPYYALLTSVLENASVDKEELTAEEEEVANDLRMIQYDITVGKSYISDYKDFFEIN